MDLISRDEAKSRGLKRYFTGKPCIHGHVVEQRVSDYGCVECSRLKASSPEERARRSDYMARHQREYRREHPDRVSATEAKRDKTARAAARRLARAEGSENHKEVLKRSYQKHKTKRDAYTKAWRTANPEATSLHVRAAKAKRRAAEGSYKIADIRRLLVEQSGKCAGCERDILKHYEIDHIVALARGGTNWPDNLQLLCRKCNRSKHAKTMTEWRAR